MPVVRCGFELRPVGFFDRNPALDVPPPAAHCGRHEDHPLYWSPGTAAMAPQACLEEAGAEYEMVQVRRDGYTVIEPEGYLELQPEGRIPALRDGDLVLHEAAAICMHIADRFPDSGLLPPVGTAERAHAYRWLTYLTNTLQATYQMWYQTDRFIQGEAVRAGVQRDLEPRLDEIFDWIDSQLEDGRPYLSATRSRRPTSTAYAHPLGPEPAPEGVDAAGARRALPAPCGAAERGRDAREAGHRGRARRRGLSHFMFWTIAACVSLAFFMMLDSASSIFERRSIAI